MAFYRTHNRVTLDTGTELITKQSHKKECDINNILSQYKKTGIINHINNNKPLYEELPSDIDYQSSLNLLMSADYTFSTLPSKVRDHFDNSPEAFLRAFSDPAQEPYLREYGLLNPLPPKAEELPASAPTPVGA